MNRNTPQEMIAIIQAHLDGKQLQYWSRAFGAHPGKWDDVVDTPVFSFSDTIYRIKPVPKKVPLSQSDIPLDRPVWIQQPGLEYDMVVGITTNGLYTRDSWIPFENLARCSYYITFDGGKTWQKCEKEVAE